MVMQQAAGGKLSQRYGQAIDVAVAAHANDPVDTGFQRLPAPIPAGIARVDPSIGFYEYKPDSKQKMANGQLAYLTKELYFGMTAVAVSPDSIVKGNNILPVKGGQTRIFEPMHDTMSTTNKLTTQEAHVAEVLNHFKLLAGGNEGGQAFVDQFLAAYPNKGDAMEAMAEALNAVARTPAGIYTKFNTEEGQTATDPKSQYYGKAPMVFEHWTGATTWTPPGSQMQDNSGPPPAAALNGQAAAHTNPPAPTGGGTAVAAPTATPAISAMDDLAALVKLANGDDQSATDAQKRLAAIALGLGIPQGDTGVPNTVDGCETWQELADLIAKTKAPATAPPMVMVEEPEPWKAKDLCRVTLGVMDKATKKQAVDEHGKPKTRQVQCEITAVYPDGTADLLNLDSKAVYPKTPLSTLSPIS